MNKNSKELVNLFFDLVRIDSPSGHEREIGLWVKNYLEKLGLKVIIDKEGNLFSKISGVGQPVLFCSHLDTVEPGRGIQPVIKNGLIQSKGKTILGADNKVVVACILLAVKKILAQKKPHPPLELVFSTREETDGGIKSFNTKKLSAKLGFVFDCVAKDLGRVIIISPYISDFKAIVKGKGSHASKPEEGVNALKIASKIISKSPLGKLDQNSTFNIGLINGGTATNAVPSLVEFSGDIRSYSRDKFRQHKLKFEKMGEAIAKKMGGKFSVSWQPYCQGYRHRLKLTPMTKLKTIYQELGLRLEPIKSTVGSDANFLNSKGIRTFVLGDGVEGAHTVREKIALKNLSKLYQIIYTLMTQW